VRDGLRLLAAKCSFTFFPKTYNNQKSMPTSMLQYEMLPTTWFYVSTLIILAVFFKFSRFWSVRNIDLVTIILITPGLILLAINDNLFGYVWLFSVYAILLLRLFFDTVMLRRPLLEPNLTPGGLNFSCLFLFLFVIAALTVNRGNKIDTVRTVRFEHILTTRHIDQKIGMNPTSITFPAKELPNLQPGFRPFLAFSEHTNLISTPPPKIRLEMLQNKSVPINFNPLSFLGTLPPDHPANLPPKPKHNPNNPETNTTEKPDKIKNIPQLIMLSEPEASQKTETDNEQINSKSPVTLQIPTPTLKQFSLMLLVSLATQLAIVIAFVYIGHCHFGNIRTGVACATLYLLLPYTNQMVGRLDHIVPAALILWGVAFYRSPVYSGFCIGAAASLVFYPIFLVPLWCSFYWYRGWVRFLIGTSIAIALFAFLLTYSPANLGTYSEQLVHMFGKSSFKTFSHADGFWNHYETIYRVPVIACFFAICFGMLLWPQRKHLAILLNCSTIIMLGTQFWQLHQGGLYIAWFAPLLILTIFRPNLEDRVAQATVY
jgi:hypothetical protein